MKKILSLLAALFILHHPWSITAGTNGFLAVNTNTWQVVPTNVWASNAPAIAAGLGLGGALTNSNGGLAIFSGGISNQAAYVASNAATRAFVQLTTNAHLHLTDEQGTTVDTHTNAVLAILGTNGLGVTMSNGNVIATGAVTAQNFVGGGNDITGVLGTSITSVGGLYPLALSTLPPAVATNWSFPATNGTAVFQAAFTSGTTVMIPPGTYWVTNLFAGENTTILGYGATLRMPTNVTGYVIQVPPNVTNFHCFGLTLDGGIYLTPGSTLPAAILGGGSGTLEYNYTVASGNGAAPASARSGMKCSMLGLNSYAGNTALGFNIAGFYLYNTNGSGLAQNIPHGQFDHNRALQCYIGLYAPAAVINDFDANNNYVFFVSSDGSNAEYTTVEDFQSISNTYGLVPAAGNCRFIGCDVSEFVVGASIDLGYNIAHGEFIGCSFNHPFAGGPTPYCVKMRGFSSGELFSGCVFFGDNNNFMFDQVENVNFTGCCFASGTFIATNLAGLVNLDSSCIMGVDAPYTFVSDGTGLVTNYMTPSMTNNRISTNLAIGSQTLQFTNGVLIGVH